MAVVEGLPQWRLQERPIELEGKRAACRRAARRRSDPARRHGARRTRPWWSPRTQHLDLDAQGTGFHRCGQMDVKVGGHRPHVAIEHGGTHGEPSCEVHRVGDHADAQRAVTVDQRVRHPERRRDGRVPGPDAYRSDELGQVAIGRRRFFARGASSDSSSGSQRCDSPGHFVTRPLHDCPARSWDPSVVRALARRALAACRSRRPSIRPRCTASSWRTRSRRMTRRREGSGSLRASTRCHPTLRRAVDRRRTRSRCNCRGAARDGREGTTTIERGGCAGETTTTHPSPWPADSRPTHQRQCTRSRRCTTPRPGCSPSGRSSRVSARCSTSIRSRSRPE